MREGTKVKYSKDVAEFIKSHNALITSNDNKYYKVEAIFKETEEENVFEVFSDSFELIAIKLK